MQRMLLTGISGVGKSAVTAALTAHGYQAVDLDSDAFSMWVDMSDALAVAAGSPVEAGRDWVWREDRMAVLLADENADVLIVSGCAANMGTFLPQFDRIILLSAPPDLIVARLAARTNNAYGKHPDEVARVLDLKAIVEPRLRRIADHEIDTAAPLNDVVEAVLQVVRTG